MSRKPKNSKSKKTKKPVEDNVANIVSQTCQHLLASHYSPVDGDSHELCGQPADEYHSESGKFYCHRHFTIHVDEDDTGGYHDEEYSCDGGEYGDACDPDHPSGD